MRKMLVLLLMGLFTLSAALMVGCAPKDEEPVAEGDPGMMPPEPPPAPEGEAMPAEPGAPGEPVAPEAGAPGEPVAPEAGAPGEAAPEAAPAVPEGEVAPPPPAETP